MAELVVIQEQNFAGGSHIISMNIHASKLDVKEYLSGIEVEDMFGDPEHISVLTLDASTQRSFLSALGGDKLSEEITQLFAQNKAAWLSDIQDLLDRLELDYTYVSYGPHGVAYHPVYFGA